LPRRGHLELGLRGAGGGRGEGVSAGGDTTELGLNRGGGASEGGGARAPEGGKGRTLFLSRLSNGSPTALQRLSNGSLTFMVSSGRAPAQFRMPATPPAKSVFSTPGLASPSGVRVLLRNS
jgi:hypothetical protein